MRNIFLALAAAVFLTACQTDGITAPATSIDKVEAADSVYLNRTKIEHFIKNETMLYWVVDDESKPIDKLLITQKFLFTGPEHVTNTWGKRERVLNYTVGSEPNGEKAYIELKGVGQMFIKKTREGKLYCSTFNNSWARCVTWNMNINKK